MFPSTTAATLAAASLAAAPLILLPIDLLDGGVDIDGHRGIARTGTELPRVGQHLLSGGVELADMTEGEGPEERAEPFKHFGIKGRPNGWPNPAGMWT